MKTKIAKSVVGLFFAGAFFATVSAKNSEITSTAPKDLVVTNYVTSSEVQPPTATNPDSGWFCLFGSEWVVCIK